MNPDNFETQPAFETPRPTPKPKLHWLLKLALISSAVCLLCSVIVIYAFRPPFMINVILAFILFSIAGYAGLISVGLYVAATISASGKRLLAFALGFASFCILIAFGTQAASIFHENQYIAFCQWNLQSIRASLNQYPLTHASLLPAPNWCDVLKTGPNITPHIFVCKASLAKQGQSSYALNKNLIGQKLANTNPSTVMIFETKPGWNQIGDANALSLNHGNGCNVLFVNGTIRFITKDKISQLRWNP